MKIIAFFCMCLFLSLFVCPYELNTEKFNSNSHDKTNLKFSLMKNFAKNLMDTKKFKISSNLRARFTKKTYQDLSPEGDEIYLGSVIRDPNSGEMTFHKDYYDNVPIQRTKKLIARARYNKSLNRIGWSKLHIETFDNAPPEMISWAAGFLEGKLTAPQILDFYNNLVGIHEKESEYLDQVFKYYENVEKFIRRKTHKDSLEGMKDIKELEYWISVAMTQAQSDGLLQGYNSIMKKNELNFSQIYFLNADGEVPELLNVFKYKKQTYNGSNYSFKEKKNKKKEKFSKEYLKEYFGSEDPEMVWNKLMANSHCSAIIKLIKDDNNRPTDLFVGHTTWDSYSEMHRIFKKYSFSYTMYETESKHSEITFSSYPGTLTSTDDFYLLNKKIVVLETTLEMLDKSIYEKNMPNSDSHVPNYIRISVANRLANSAKEWTDIFKNNNGGTYNSQWMIVDYAKFKNMIKNESFNNSDDNNNKSNSFLNSVNNNFSNEFNNYNIENNKKDSSFLENNNQQNIQNKKYLSEISLFDTIKQSENTQQKRFNWYRFKQRELTYYNEGNYKEVFFLLEQVPGYIEIKDMTNLLLNKGYWGSFNRPYFDKTSQDSGYTEMSSRYGRTYSYYDNPRAQIISKEINNVRNIEDMKSIMQSNTNIFNPSNHMNVISPRYDISENQELKRPSGGIDSKIVNSNFVSNGGVLAISGPSKESNLKAFDWNDFPDEPHHGLPDVWNFDWNIFDDNFLKN